MAFIKCVDRLQDWASHSTSREKVQSLYARKHSFRVTVPHIRQTSVFCILSVRTGHLKIIVSSAEIEVEIEEMSPTRFLCLSGISKQRRDIWKDATFLDVSMHALIQLEDTVGICCELWLDRQLELNTY